MAAADPTDVVAIPLTSRSARVTWTDNAAAEETYKVEYDDGGGWTTAADDIAAGSETYDVTGLDPHTLHTFRVSALDSINGNSATVESNEVYTYPEAEGYYYAYNTDDESPTAWTWLLRLQGQAPFFRVSGVKTDNSRIYQSIEDLENYRFGPERTLPTFLDL